MPPKQTPDVYPYSEGFASLSTAELGMQHTSATVWGAKKPTNTLTVLHEEGFEPHTFSQYFIQRLIEADGKALARYEHSAKAENAKKENPEVTGRGKLSDRWKIIFLSRTDNDPGEIDSKLRPNEWFNASASGKHGVPYGMLEAIKDLQRLIVAEEIGLGGDSQRLALAGVGQGAAIALQAFLFKDYKLGGLLICDLVMPFFGNLFEEVSIAPGEQETKSPDQPNEAGISEGKNNDKGEGSAFKRPSLSLEDVEDSEASWVGLWKTALKELQLLAKDPRNEDGMIPNFKGKTVVLHRWRNKPHAIKPSDIDKVFFKSVMLETEVLDEEDRKVFWDIDKDCLTLFFTTFNKSLTEQDN